MLSLNILNFLLFWASEYSSNILSAAENTDMAINCYYYPQCQKRVIKCYKKFRSKKHPLRRIFSQDLEPHNSLKIFLNFTNFEHHYSYKIWIEWIELNGNAGPALRASSWNLSFSCFSGIEVTCFSRRWRILEPLKKKGGKRKIRNVFGRIQQRNAKQIYWNPMVERRKEVLLSVSL